MATILPGTQHRKAQELRKYSVLSEIKRELSEYKRQIRYIAEKHSIFTLKYEYQ